jgi:tetratricopeptide (TPR) repeat protein
VVRSEPSGNDRALEEQVKAGGDSLMQERRYTEALDAYNRAFDFYPDPRLHYNRASAYLALGRYPEALDQLETFRSRAPTALQEKVPDLDALIETTRAKVSSIGVITPVRGALVTWRGQVIGTTPLAHPHRVNTSPGTLEIIADGYEPYREDLVLTGKRTLTLEPHLVRRAGATLLVVHSPVLGARVALDGRDLGLVPAEAIVAPGSHRIAVTHADYERAEVSAVVAQGQSRTVDVQLEGTKPIYAKWWFWTGVGVAVAGTVTAIIIANTSRSADTGDIQPGKVSAPLKLQGLMRF